MRKPEEIWWSRNPSHDFDMDGKDRFYETAFLCMDEYAKQVSIDFAIFCSNKGEGHNGSWRGNVMAGEGVWTTEELYAEFLKQYNQ